MNNKNFRIRNCVSLLLALIAVVTLTFACKAAGADITDEGDTNNDLTVTIDANGGTGGASSKTVSKGGTLAELTSDDLPKKTDYEIAYWSTVHDSYKDIFNFGSTPINSNITIYPHWRLTLDAVKKGMEGNWVEIQNTNRNGTNLYKVIYSNSYVAKCYLSSQTILALDDPTNSTYAALLNKLLSINIDASLTPGTYPSTYTAGMNNYNISESYGNYTLSLLDGTTTSQFYYTLPTCQYGFRTTIKLNSYVAQDSSEIYLDSFFNTTPSEVTKTDPVDGTVTKDLYKVILKSYTASEFVIYEEYSKMTRRFIKQN